MNPNPSTWVHLEDCFLRAWHIKFVEIWHAYASTEDKWAITTLVCPIHRKEISDTEKVSVLTKAAEHTGRGAKKSDPQLITITPWLLGECGATADGKVPSRLICNGVILFAMELFLQSVLCIPCSHQLRNSCASFTPGDMHHLLDHHFSALQHTMHLVRRIILLRFSSKATAKYNMAVPYEPD